MALFLKAGDVIFSLEAKPHAVFTRKGPNLEMKKEINLLQVALSVSPGLSCLYMVSQALTGFSFVVTHLDGRKLLVKVRAQCIRNARTSSEDFDWIITG